MCEFCGRNYEGDTLQLPLTKLSGSGILTSFIQRNNDGYEILFKIEDGEYTLGITKCPICDGTLSLDHVYYVKTSNGYICEDMYANRGIMKSHPDKEYAFPVCFKSIAEINAKENNGEVIEEVMFVDEAYILYNKFR